MQASAVRIVLAVGARLVGLAAAACVLAGSGPGAVAADEDRAGLIDLTTLSAWRGPVEGWQVVGGAALEPGEPKHLVGKPGEGVLLNEPRENGKTPSRNLLSRQAFGDIEFRCEFMVPKGSNSGVKFEGLYEIQIADSWGAKELSASGCGGVYPRAELTPRYHHIDKGYPPRENASKPPGDWQQLQVLFRAPRFDADGKKTANARFEKVVLNGRVIHEDLEVPTPTGHAWHDKEVPTGPILLQADHGQVAFRHVQVRPLAGH